MSPAEALAVLRTRHPGASGLPALAAMERWLAVLPELGPEFVEVASRETEPTPARFPDGPLADALARVIHRGGALAREACGLLSPLGSAAGRPSTLAALGTLLGSPEPDDASTAAQRLWALRRQGVDLGATCRAALAAAAERPDEGVRCFAALALALDGGTERERWLARARGCSPPADFSEPVMTDVGWSWCAVAPSGAAQPRTDPSVARIASTRCLACGSVRTVVLYASRLEYSIGILESVEVRCEECGFHSRHDVDL